MSLSVEPSIWTRSMRKLVPMIIVWAGILSLSQVLALETSTSPISTLFTRQPVERPSELRIMPLGASIMSGWGSSYDDGLRKQLRNALRNDGFEVDMVGTRTATKNNHPTMKDKDHEAKAGDRIDQIHERLLGALGYKPNIVIINAGTNDANQNFNVDGVGTRMSDMLNDLWRAEGMGETCVILSTILPSDHSVGKLHYKDVNRHIREVYQSFKDKKCIYLAEMDAQSGEAVGWIRTWEDFDTDRIHPNDEGHRKMAYVFYNAIRQALKDQKVKSPSGPVAGGPKYCEKVAGSGISAGGLTQKGSGEDDGIYLHSSQDMGVVMTITSDFDRNQWRFTRLFNHDYDDLIGWGVGSNSADKIGVWANSADGKGQFSRIEDARLPFPCIPLGLHFIDMNADGLDDVVCISASGDLYLGINNGDGNRAANKSPTFSNKGMVRKNVGVPQARVRLGDIDGDGRGDYIVDKQNNGNWQVYRNGWVKDTPDYWQDLGTRFTAKGKGDLRGVRFEDLNGDGRDDWIFVEEDGKTDVYTNSRSCKEGKDGDGLNVAWRQAHHKDWKSGEVFTHGGMAQFQNKDEKNLRDRIHFARIYGSPSAFGNRPRKDYVFLQHDKDGDKHRFRMRVYKNTGGGSTKLKADGVKYCNMMGHSDGRMDYVWTLSTGRMTLFPNLGKTSVADGKPFWDKDQVIWTPPRDMDRRDLHLADYDGDGACDIIYVNPSDGGIEVFINNYPKQGRWDFTHNANPAPSLRCNEKRGLGFHDLAVRFADLTGNGRTDYLCIQKDGTTSAWVQSDEGSWENWGQIKRSEAKDRANIRYHDVNGDKKADMIFVDKFNGDGFVWYNTGRASNPDANSGSSLNWKKGDQRAYDSRYAGTCQYFPDLNGDGRADLHSITGTFTNEAETSFSPPCGSVDNTGDDGPITNPNLPQQPGNPLVKLPSYS